MTITDTDDAGLAELKQGLAHAVRLVADTPADVWDREAVMAARALMDTGGVRLSEIGAGPSTGELCYLLTYQHRLVRYMACNLGSWRWRTDDVVTAIRMLRVTTDLLRTAGPPNGDQLAEFRQHAGLSQTELAERLGLPVSLIKCLEDGTRELADDDTLALAANVFRFLDMWCFHIPPDD